MPEPWIWISGAFFLFGTIAFIVLSVLLIRMMAVINEMKPRIERLTERMDSMAEKLESAASSAKSAVETVGSGTRQIVGSVQGTIEGSLEKLGKFSVVIVAATTILRLYREFVAIRQAQVDSEDDKAT